MTRDDSAPVRVEQDRYATLNIGERGLVIYDREDRTAWIQSTIAVGTTEWR